MTAFTIVVGILVSFERFTRFKIGTLRNRDGNNVKLGSGVHICCRLQKVAWPSGEGFRLDIRRSLVEVLF